MTVPPADTWRQAVVNVVTTLGSSPTLAAGFAGATVGPIVYAVERLDRDQPYYVFEAVHGAAITGRLAIEAASGRLLGAEAVSTADHPMPPYVDPIAALKAADIGAPPPSGPVGRQTWTWGWRPCRESTSRFLPFAVFTTPVRFVRADGRVFTRLTTAGHG